MFGQSIKSWANRFFKTRSADRDAETDYSRVEPVFRSIGQALKAAQAEHSGLDNRMQDVLARASISLGNGSDGDLAVRFRRRITPSLASTWRVWSDTNGVRSHDARGRCAT